MQEWIIQFQLQPLLLASLLVLVPVLLLLEPVKYLSMALVPIQGWCLY